MNPADLKYTETHEWARYDADSQTVTVGITQFATKQLGDIVFLELPAEGSAVTKGAAFGVIESVKAAVDLTSPVTGQVVQANADVTESLDQIGEDPYGAGWMIKVRACDPDELDELMDAAAYEKLTAE